MLWIWEIITSIFFQCLLTFRHNNTQEALETFGSHESTQPLCTLHKPTGYEKNETQQRRSFPQNRLHIVFGSLNFEK